MKKYLLQILFNIFLLTRLMFCYSQTPINGSVYGRQGGLQSATVLINDTTLLTDKNGDFYLKLKPGSYTIIISNTGYKKFVQQIKIEAADTQSFGFTMSSAEQMDEVVVLGSRSTIQRSNLTTAIPVDIFLSKYLSQTGQSSLTQMLTFAVPSLNASRQLVNEPITLRGLDPDHVLILVNGTRYHNMAYLNDGKIRGILGRGSIVNDLNSIPFSAIEKVEILRDGASAQYGSDAIAGVINIHLKNSAQKTSVQFHTGQFYEGDGVNVSLGINQGISLNKKGFLNISADILYRNPTYRGGEYKGTVYVNNPLPDDSIIHSRNFNRDDVSNAGTTKLHSFAILVNGGYQVKQHTELFWTGGLNNRETLFTGSYVFPKNTRQVNPYLYPDGFKPRSKQNILDVSGIAGAKGETNNKWHWEYSSAYGNNAGKYYAENTNNASQYFSLGNIAPTAFYTGTIIFQQLVNNMSFTKDLSKKTGRLKLFNLAFGAEWRLENYKIKDGEEAAWINYDPLERKQGGSQNGLIFRPENVIHENRNVLGTYIDIESEFTNNLLVDLASRYEHYNDFGGNLAGKVAARYKLSNQFSLRGSISNGFRAPGLQQRYFSNTTKGLVSSGTSLLPVTSGIFRNNGNVANAFGIPSLQAEKSINLNGGFTSTIFHHISLTADAYWIQIRNRIVLSGRFDKATNPDVKNILINFPEIDQVQFFTNAINTKTQGFDMALSGNWNIQKTNLMVMLAANVTQTKLFGDIKTSDKLPADSLNTNTLFNREERTKVEKGQPRDKIILSLNYTTAKFCFQLRNTHFGKTVIAFDSKDISRDEYFSSKLLTDLSINYTPKTWLSITVGANNIFDVYPTPLKNSLNTGEGIFIYAQEASPFGYNGGYFFMSMEFKF